MLRSSPGVGSACCGSNARRPQGMARGTSMALAMGFCIASMVCQSSGFLLPTPGFSSPYATTTPTRPNGPFQPSSQQHPQPSMASSAVAADRHHDAAPSATSKSPLITHTPIRLTLPERARTVTHVANAATLCTFAEHGAEGARGFPFGSYVDYILDDKGWPVLLLSEQSLHTQNLRTNPRVSLFVQMPKNGAQSAAALSRVTLVGNIAPVPQDELPALKTAYSIVHSYSEQLVDSPKFTFCKLQPREVYFVGGFGVLSKWIPVSDYEKAVPDVLAHDVSRIVNRLNTEHEAELRLMCRQFLATGDVDRVQAMAVDRLGMDLRVTSGQLTDEYRIGFRQKVSSTEDAKSEIIKMFQEAWEREQGYAWIDELPPLIRYAEDILRN